MKTFSKGLSLFLALIMLFSILTIAPISASAAESDTQVTAIDKEEENIDHMTGNEDPDDDDDGDDEELPEGDMAKPKSMTVENIEIYEDVDARIVNSYDEDDNEHEWSSYAFNDQIKCTITLEDDSVISTDEDGCVVYNGKEFEIEFDDGQSWETPWGTGDHDVEYSILGLKTTAVVTVLPSPIDRVEFRDVTCVEGTNGWISSYYSWDDDNDKNVLERVYYAYNPNPDFTVYMKNGDKIESEEGSVNILGVDREAETDTRQYLDPWGVGTRKVKATLLNKEYEFNYTITESDIKSISVENVTVYDGVDTSIAHYDLDGEEHSYKRFNYKPSINITLKDGSTVTKTLEDNRITVGSNEYRIDACDDQDDDNEWGTGDHSAYIFVGAIVQEIKVTVVDSPLKSLTIEDVEIQGGIDCTEEYDWDVERDWDKYYYTPNFKVELKGGQTVNGHNGSVLVDGKTYKLEIEDGQSYDNQWEYGKTYKATGSIGSLKTDFNVTVKNDTVKEIKLLNDTIDIHKGVDSYWDDEDGFERYSYAQYVNLEITMFDGTKVTKNDEGDYVFRGKELSVEFTDDQSKDKVWGTGVHQATVSLWNASTDFNVTVEDTPAAKAQFDNVEIIEGTNKDDDNSYAYEPSFKVTLKNGTVLESEGNGTVIYNGESISPVYTDDQSENPWGVGKHTVTASIMGVTAEFTVEILPTPVAKVELDTINVIENTTGYIETEYDEVTDEDHSYFCYDPIPNNFKVTLKDGTVLESDEYGYLEYNGSYYSANNIITGQSFNNQWEAGKTYTCTAMIIGFTFEFKAKVIGSPVKSAVVGDITLIDGYDSYIEYDDEKEWKCFYYDIYSDVKVTLKNGEVIEGENGEIEYNDLYYGITDIEDDQSPDNEWKAGNTYTVTGKILGYTVPIKVHVVSNPIDGVTVNGDVIVTENDENYGYYEEEYEDGKYLGRYFRYEEIVPTNFTVKFKNGKVVNSDEDGYVYYSGRYICASLDGPKTVQDYFHQWTAGNSYTAIGRLMGFEFNYKVLVLAKDAPIPPSATKIILTAQKTKIFVGNKVNVIANISNPSGNTTFTSSNSNVATVNSRGQVTAKAAGKVTITATNNTVSASVTITVSKKTNTAKIKVSKPAVKFAKLEKKNQTVKAVTVKSPKGKVSFKKAKGDKKITVNKKTGKITLKKGMKRKTYTIRVKVTVAGNNVYKPFKKTVKVKIKVN